MLLDPIFFDFMSKLFKLRLSISRDQENDSVGQEMIRFWFDVVLHGSEKTASGENWSEVICDWIGKHTGRAEWFLNSVISTEQLFLETSIVSSDTEVHATVLTLLLRVTKYSFKWTEKLLDLCFH